MENKPIIRQSKESDHDLVEIAYNLLCDLAKNHPEIEDTLWFGALASAMVEMHINTGNSYEYFCKELDNVKIFYKSWFNDGK